MQLKALDLFAGCGGLSLGLERAGFNVVLANELDRSAAETYAANHGATTLLQGDIRELDPEIWRGLRGRIDLVAGGPPCQGFSVTGRRQYGEFMPQNSMVDAFLDVVAHVMPRTVLLENVAGFRTAKLRPGVLALPFVLGRLQSLGYEAKATVLQAADYGVPSLRSRLFVVASLGALPEGLFPSPTHGAATAMDKRHVGCLEAISDLPPIAACEGVEGPVPYTSGPLNAYQSELRQGSEGVHNHVAMNHTPRLVERFKTIRPGGSSYLLPGSGVTVYKSNNQRLMPQLPSLCITANFQSNYIHPVLHRNLTAREAARLMSYPDTYVFKGKRTLMSKKFLEKYGRAAEAGLSQYNQIGNSVPPLLAAALGRSLVKMLAGKNSDQARAA